MFVSRIAIGHANIDIIFYNANFFEVFFTKDTFTNLLCKK